MLPNPSYLRGRAGKLLRANIPAARCLTEQTSATGRTSTTEPYSRPGHCLAISIASFSSATVQIKITANRFLRFGERTVGDRAALFAGNNFAFLFQWMTADAFSLCLQPLEPGHPVGHDFLNLCRRKPAVPDVTAKKQQIISFCCRLCS